MKKTYVWISDPDFRKAFMVRGENDWERHVEYFDNLLTDDTQLAYAIYIGDLHVGNCGLKYINTINKSAELWIYIGTNDFRGIGLGGKALRILLHKGKDILNLTSVSVHVADDNKLAKNLYSSQGFFKKDNCSKEWKERDVKMLRMLWKAQ